MTEQLSALVSLRWRMVRERRTRAVLLAFGSLLPTLFVVALALGLSAPPARRADVVILLPVLLLGFAILAFVSPLVAGGGLELYPSEQLVAYPIRPSTRYVAGVLLSPANVAWTANVLALVAATAYVVGSQPWALLRSSTTIALYMVAATVTGHALAWWVVGTRTTRRGRVSTSAAVVTFAVVLVAVAATVGLSTLLDRAPTRSVVISMLAGRDGRYVEWLLGLAVSALVIVAAGRLGIAAVAREQRRVGTAWTPADTPRRRRHSPSSTPYAAVLAVDRASVWRSVPVRRGAVALTAVPVVVAIPAQLPWSIVTLVPGFVAAGAGLLFGVNAFCLDGRGTSWAATVPGWSELALRSKAQVTAEASLLTAGVATAVAAVASRTMPSATDVAAVLGALVSCTALTVAACLRLSVDRPHRASLEGPRDTPAPPAAMAGYSVQLAVSTTVVGLAFSVCTVTAPWWVPALLAVCFVCLAAASIAGTRRRWESPQVRTGVLTTVAAG